MEVLVEFDYAAQNSDELTIKKGDRIRNVVRKEDGWYEGELVSNGRRGVFPDNFVKPIKQSAAILKNIGFNGLNTNPTSNSLKSPEDKKRNLANPILGSQQNSKLNQAAAALSPQPPPQSSSQQTQQQPPPVKASPTVPLKNPDQFLARVLYSYVPVNDDELPIQENDTVQVLRLIEDGWYEGVYNGRQGVFPSNYVERTNEPVNVTATSVKGDNQNGLDSAVIDSSDFADDKKKNKKVIGIGFGNIFSGKQIELKTKENFNSSVKVAGSNGSISGQSTVVKPVPPASAPPPVSILPEPSQYIEHAEDTQKQNGHKKQQHRIKARVLFNYAPTQPDELKLVQGEIIYILDKNLEDEGWWRGEIISTGKSGVFPENFVEEIPEAPPAISGVSKRKSNGGSINPMATTTPAQPLNSVVVNTQSNPAINTTIIPKQQQQNDSLTNSPSSSSSTNSISRPIETAVVSSKIIGNGAQKMNGTGNENGQVLSSLEDNLSKSDMSEDLDDLQHSDSRSKLTHIKKTRQFNKRPPSFRSKNKSEEENESNGIKHSNSYEKQPHLSGNGVGLHADDVESTQFLSRQMTPTQIKSPSSPTRPLSSISSVTTAAANNVSPAMMSTLVEEIQHLRQELDLVKKESTQTHNDYKQVQTELSEIKKGHDEQMKKMQKRLQDLISEIDDEKKTRLALQVELERLKKTIND